MGDKRDTPLVSVVIPLYNVEKYMRQCVDSVLAQTYVCLDVILVDDGSADASGDIAEEYARSDSRVRVIRQPNSGPAAARNAGIEAAHGEWIAFIDSDDVVGAYYIGTLLRACRDGASDVACVGIRRFRSDSSEEDARVVASLGTEAGNVGFRTLPPRLALENMLYQTSAPDASVWNKMFHRSLFDAGLRFRSGIIYEDLDLMSRLLLSASRVAVVDTPLYGYRSNPASLMLNFTPRRLDVLEVTARICTLMQSQGARRLRRAAADRRMSAAFNILLLSRRYLKQRKDGDSGSECFLPGVLERSMSDCAGIIRAQRRKSFFNPRVRLKNKLGILLSFMPGFLPSRRKA